MITLSLNKIKPQINSNQPITVKSLVKDYYNYCDCNAFDDLKCPCCKMKGTLFYHKKYERNLTYMEEDEVIDMVISITVLVCKNCVENNNKQKYHALLPVFILPYHVHESSLIINSIYEYLVKEQKLKEILEKINITHKLFYDWLKKIKIYSLVSSTILKENNILKIIITKIFALNERFLIDFFANFEHPFFLFKRTCVPLCITP